MKLYNSEFIYYQDFVNSFFIDFNQHGAYIIQNCSEFWFLVNAPKMAATHFSAQSAIFGIIICLSFHFCLPDINFRFHKDTFVLSTTFHGLPRIVKTADGRTKLARPICTWHKRGLLLIAMPLKVDLTIHMDVESNPGPTSLSLTEATHHEHNVFPGFQGFLL